MTLEPQDRTCLFEKGLQHLKRHTNKSSNTNDEPCAGRFTRDSSWPLLPEHLHATGAYMGHLGVVEVNVVVGEQAHAAVEVGRQSTTYYGGITPQLGTYQEAIDG